MNITPTLAFSSRSFRSCQLPALPVTFAGRSCLKLAQKCPPLSHYGHMSEVWGDCSEGEVTCGGPPPSPLALLPVRLSLEFFCCFRARVISASLTGTAFGASKEPQHTTHTHTQIQEHTHTHTRGNYFGHGDGCSHSRLCVDREWKVPALEAFYILDQSSVWKQCKSRVFVCD